MDKVKLFIHIGTEKTGSSYVQSLFARNREQLIKQGIYYPPAGRWEREMKKGRISPGNAEELLRLIRLQRWEELRSMLRSHRQKAENQECAALLYSNESLIEVFGDEKLFPSFLELCRGLSFDTPNLLLILRSPVDQALSLYKHRAKRGDIAEIEAWLKGGYHLPRHLDNFVTQLKSSKVSCMVRRYEKDSAYLTRIFFHDWLQVGNPLVWEDSFVNPSLTLSELAVLKRIKQVSPRLVPFFYEKMLAIPVSAKSDNHYLENYITGSINRNLVRFHSLWLRCNELLPLEEQIQLPLVPEVIEDEKKLVTLSVPQVEALVQLMNETSGFQFKIQLLRNFVRPYLAKTKWAVLNMIK